MNLLLHVSEWTYTSLHLLGAGGRRNGESNEGNDSNDRLHDDKKMRNVYVT